MILVNDIQDIIKITTDEEKEEVFNCFINNKDECTIREFKLSIERTDKNHILILVFLSKDNKYLDSVLFNQEDYSDFIQYAVLKELKNYDNIKGGN